MPATFLKVLLIYLNNFFFISEQLSNVCLLLFREVLVGLFVFERRLLCLPRLYFFLKNTVKAVRYYCNFSILRYPKIECNYFEGESWIFSIITPACRPRLHWRFRNNLRLHYTTENACHDHYIYEFSGRFYPK